MKKKNLIKEISYQVEILSTVAIPREKDAYKFYVGMANRSSDKHTKAFFVDLARQEIGHEKKLVRVRDDLVKKLNELRS